MHQVGFYYTDVSRCTVKKTYFSLTSHMPHTHTAASTWNPAQLVTVYEILSEKFFVVFTHILAIGRSNMLTAVIVNSCVPWDVTPCSLTY